MQKLYCLFFLCFLTIASFAQVSSPFSFTHYKLHEGLASNEINSVVQDSTGYLWIATTAGLQRYDGFRYKTFRHQKNISGTIPDNVLSQVMIDKHNKLWVLSGGGEVGVFDKNNFIYHHVAVKRKHSTAPHTEKRLIPDEYGNLFLLFRGQELLQYDKKKNEFSSAANFIPLKSEWGITSMSQQPGTHKYWLGLQNGGLVIYNHQTKNISHNSNNIEKEEAVELFGSKISFTHSFFDNQGRVWFESWGEGIPHAMQYNLKTKKLQQYSFIKQVKTYHELYGFMQQSDGRIWIKGLQLFGFFDEGKNNFEMIPSDFRAEHGITYQGTKCLYEDREKNVWVGTHNNGLYRFNPSQQYFTNIAHINPVTKLKGEGSVMSFIQTNNGDIITSAWGDGLYRYDKNFNILPLSIKGFKETGLSSVWSMYASKDKDVIWMATQPGIFKYSQSKGAITYYNPPILQNRTVRQIVEDKYGQLWLGMQGLGLFKWSPTQAIPAFSDGFQKIKYIPETNINHMALDNEGWLWLATGTDGVYAIDPLSAKPVLHLNKRSTKNIIDNRITAVLPYNDSLMIFSTLKTIHVYNKSTFLLKTLIDEEALTGNISSLTKDEKNNFWVSTTNALYRINLNSKTNIKFDRRNGITNDQFVLAANYTLSDGRILLGNANEFISFNPLQIDLQKTAPHVAITDLNVRDKNLPVDSVLSLKKLKLDHNDNSININFSTLNYSSPHSVIFKLEGIDKDWRTADKNMNAVYSYLPSGNYSFILRVLNSEGTFTGSETILEIKIRTPFWETWWFYSLLAITAASFLYWLDRQRMQKKEALQKVRNDIATGLHQEINNALNNINILSEIARIKSDKEPQKAKEFLEQIHSKSHNMIIALDDMLWSLAPANDNMDKTISRIKEFADALTQRHGVSIELLIDKKVEGVELDMKLRHEAFLLFREGLRSLVEAGTQRCIVHIALEKNKLLFSIEFENEGCNMQQLNNLLHRRDMEKRLQSLNAKLDVQMHKSRSIFYLQLPL